MARVIETQAVRRFEARLLSGYTVEELKMITGGFAESMSDTKAYKDFQNEAWEENTVKNYG